MNHSIFSKLIVPVVMSAREYEIGSLLFRNSVAEMLKVNVSDIECLILLTHKGIATPSELSRYAGISSGSTTAMIDRLEKNKCIERIPNPEDRRSIHILIVKETADKITALFDSVREAQEELISHSTQKEQEFLLHFFKESVDIWEREREVLNSRHNKNGKGGNTYAKLSK